jgi:hypothetical protein
VPKLKYNIYGKVASGWPRGSSTKLLSGLTYLRASKFVIWRCFVPVSGDTPLSAFWFFVVLLAFSRRHDVVYGSRVYLNICVTSTEQTWILSHLFFIHLANIRGQYFKVQMLRNFHFYSTFPLSKGYSLNSCAYFILLYCSNSQIWIKFREKLMCWRARCDRLVLNCFHARKDGRESCRVGAIPQAMKGPPGVAHFANPFIWPFLFACC